MATPLRTLIPSITEGGSFSRRKLLVGGVATGAAVVTTRNWLLGSTAVPTGMAYIPGGRFMMGSEDRLAHENEMPVHPVRVDPFYMDVLTVTNADFARFVRATGYVTVAERPIEWEVLRLQLPEGTAKPDNDLLTPGSLVFRPTDKPVYLDDWRQWWQWVPGASWHAPEGPSSNVEGKAAFPVVHIAYEDATAYARWVGKRLPTEAEWEIAARGGLESERYSWGDRLQPDGRSMANIWQGQFPLKADMRGLVAAGSYPKNGFGLADMTGNAWQWVSDLYRADAYRRMPHQAEASNPQGPSDSFDPSDPLSPLAAKRVIRGGSFLCSPDYCLSYRPSARRGQSPDSGMSHIGFRLVLDA